MAGAFFRWRRLGKVAKIAKFATVPAIQKADLSHKARENAKEHTSAMVLDFTSVPFVDVSAARAFENIVEEAHHSGRDVYTYGMTHKVKETIIALNPKGELRGDGHYQTRTEALKAAVINLQAE